MDIGLAPLGEPVGLCCHFMVFERVGMPALGEGFGAVSGASADRCGDRGVEGVLPRLTEPKPLNSGIVISPEAPRWAGSLLAIVSSEAVFSGVDSSGEPKAARVLLGVCAVLL